ncbi:hypothetical protein ACP4OV_014744 [Aristida adscensionis]
MGEMEENGVAGTEKAIGRDEAAGNGVSGTEEVTVEEDHDDAAAKRNGADDTVPPPPDPKTPPADPHAPPPEPKKTQPLKPLMGFASARGGIVASKTRIRAAASALALTSLLLWSLADQPRRVAWAFTAAAAACLAAGAVALTEKMAARTVLVSVSYLALVASAVAHLSSSAGVFIMLLDTAYAAVLFGYALAEHRQREGSEQSAEAVPDPSSRTREELREKRAIVIMVFCYSTIASLLFIAAAVWVICYEETYWLVLLLSYLIDLALFCWTSLVTMHMLHGALITAEGLAYIYWFGVSLLLPDYLISTLFGESIGMLVHPLGMIGMAGFLGYSLGVYARHLVIVKGKEA